MRAALRWTIPVLTGIALLCAKQISENRLSAFVRPEPEVSLETAQFYSRSLRRFSLGFDNLIADLAWVQLLQGASHEALTHGGVSWEYAKLHSIATLDPKFDRVHWFGASYVSIFRRDKIGAKDLLQRWVKQKPTLWNSHYTLGFHLFHEMGDYEGGAKEILLAASFSNAPSYLSALGVRLLSESGQYFSALQTAAALYATLRDTEGKYRLRRRLRSLNYNLQKTEWVQALKTFREKNRKEPNSMNDLAPFLSQREIASLTRRLVVDDEIQPLLQESFQFRYDPAAKAIAGRAEDQDLELVGVHASKG